MGDVIESETRTERRELELHHRMWQLGIESREKALLAREAAIANAAYWYDMYRHLGDLYAMACVAHKETQALLRLAEEELARMKQI